MIRSFFLLIGFACLVACDAGNSSPTKPARAVVRNTACTSDALNGQVCRSAVRVVSGSYAGRSCTVRTLVGAVGDTVWVAPVEWIIHSEDAPDRYELRCSSY